MSQPVPPPPSALDALRSDPPPSPQPDRPLPDFQPNSPSPYSPIEREIERSERASAALAAARALARASFTDSELAADDDAGQHDFETGSWTRTEYAPLDHTVRSPADDTPGAAPRNLLGGSFNPGIAAQHGRQFPGASIAHAPIKTRSGAQARFAQESRHAPRPDRATTAIPAAAQPAPPARHDKPAVTPMPAPPAMVPVAARAPVPARRSAGEPAKFVLAAVLGAGLVLVGGGVAWYAGLLSQHPDNAAIVTPAVAAQAEAARVLSAARDIPIAPAAGLPSRRSDEEVDAALAAAARAAAVPADSVRAAGPAYMARPSPVTPPVTAAAAAPAAAHVAPHGKDSIAEAIAKAQARADRFLASDNVSGAAASGATTQARPAP
ncbi:MAG: hypothetical protein ACJ8GJ_00140 [Vitreoscilla sp.]